MISSKRILITTYHQAFLSKGGGEFELLEVASSLKMLGQIIDIYGPYSRSIDNYDIVLHFSVHGGGLELLRDVKRLGKTIVLWPNFWISDFDRVSIETIVEHVQLADLVVFKSNSEKELLQSIISIPESKTKMIYTGLDSCFAKAAPAKLFHTVYGLQDYILWVGILEKCKNQLFAIQALAELEIPIVFVGNYRDPNYYQACLDAAPPHFKFIRVLPHKSEMHRSALQNCRAYLEVSLEPPGNSALEAGASGVPLVLTDCTWSREHFGDYAFYADPSSKDSILKAVKAALDQSSVMDLSEKIYARHKLPDVLIPLLEAIESIGT